jgi:hypothetical protein
MLRLACALAPLAILTLPCAAQVTPDELRAQIDELARASACQDSITKLEVLVFQVGEESMIAKHAFVALGDLHGADGDWESAAAYYRAAATGLLARAADGDLDFAASFAAEVAEKQPRIAAEVVVADAPREARVPDEHAAVAAASKRIEAYEALPEADRTSTHEQAHLADLREYAAGLAAIVPDDPADRMYFREEALRAYERLVFAAGDGTLTALDAYVAIGDLHAETGDFETAAAFYQSAALMLLDAERERPNERVERRRAHFERDER